MGRVRFGAVRASGPGLALVLPAATLLASPTPGHAEVIQSVTCLVEGSARYGINTEGITVTSGNAPSDANATVYAQSLGANGGVQGGNAGAVIITTDGTISAPAAGTAAVQGPGGLAVPQSAAVWAQSLGGCGNVAPGNAAGAGGTAGAVTVTANADTVIDLGPNVAGIYALSAGGQGAGYTYDATHDLGPGGDAGTVTVNFAGTINGQGADNAYGIYALSAGGASGATDSKYSVSGGDAGNVYVTLNSGARIDMSGDASIAVFAASVGGLSWYADNGTYGGHQNGDGKGVTVTTQSGVTITTSGELGIGILALSTGGNSTTSQQPPDSLQENGENAKPTDYAPPGNAGDVTVNNQATITTAGDVSVGIAAVSATGGRGAGQVIEQADGTYVIDQVGQVGPGAGSPGTVTVTNSATITTSGIGAIGILGLSLGGAGGVMDSSPGLLSLLGGTAAGTGAAGNTVEITDTGTIVTTGAAAIGILAESVGGGGGTATGTHGVVAVGTNGGAGGNGGQVEVEKLGGSIGTSGDGAFGILTQSTGGGGGNGANASGLWAAVGGAGGASGNGGEVDVTLQSSTVQTAGDFAAGVGAQSVGGGGGNGGYAKSYSLVAPVSTAIGGTGSGGGAGGVIDITVTDSSIGTSGAHAPALLAQSVGGGGGTGGAAAVYSTGVSLVVTTAIGGDASNGGAGGAVTVTGTQATYATTGLDSVGILAQSVGGGGGNGGSALSRSEALPASDLPTVSIDTSVGGTGGAGGAGGAATVSNIGKVSTQGDGSIGILAQSVGGGGGNGADASAFARSIEGALPNVKISVAVGGKGGAGGDGAAVSVTNGNPNDPCGARCAGTVTTEGDNAAGILAQSIGGGGGNGGAGNGSVSSPNLGGDTGTAIDATIGVGGTGGDGGTGGTVAVENTAGSLVQTYGSGSQGILAQSIGGGGGNAGGGTAAGSGDNVVMNVSVGGAGGTGAYAQTVTVTNEGTIATGQLVEGNGGAYTTGGDAVGILAQSIGGGGGAAGSSDAAATISTLFQIEDLLNAPSNSYIGSVTVGGTGGTGGNGGTVQVTNTGGITTLGERAYGILAQSIGGGGGTGGAATSAANSVAGGPDGGKSGTYSATVSVGGSGGAAGQGGTVTVQGFGTVLTAGYGAVGILAQSVGGGGGVGAEGSVNNTTTLGIGGDWNGKGSAGGDGSAVTVSIGPVTTLGDDAHGIVAQSIGGGGGLGSAGCTNSTEASAGGIATTLCYGNTAGLTGSFAPWNDASSYTIQIGGGAGASGAGGDVIVTVDEALSTSGARAMGVIAQSIGGGGGLVTVPAGNTASVQLQAAPGANGGASGTVTVTETATGSIATTGAGAWGILAQSLSGGGGFAGDPSLPAQALVSNTLTTSGSVGTAGAVTVNVAGSIATTGANAHGVVAQSVGGGGGIGNSAANDSLVFGNSAQIYGISEGEHAATGGAVTVTVAAGGSIKATGAGSIGILAQSTGVASSQNGYQTPPIDITIDGTVLGGTLTGATAFQPVAGLVLSGGGYASADWSAANQVTIGAGGSLGTVDGANGWAIVGSDGYTSVTNYGTVTGGINLGASFGIVTNYGLLNTGTQMNLASLVNDGTVNVAGKGAVGTTEVVGSYTQGASGTLAADIDALATQQADLLTVDGKAELLGTITPNAKNLLYGSYQVLGAGSLDAHVSAPSSLLFDWGVAVYDNQIWLEPIADFTPAGVTLSPAEASLADYLGDGWNGIGSPTFFAPLFGALSKIGDGSSYVAALKALSPEASQAQATALLSNAGTVLGAALSCPVFVTSGTLLGEDECAWAKVTGSWFSQSQTRDTQGFDVSQVTYRLGAQKELSPGWYLGGSFGAGPTSSSSDNGSSGDGYTVDGSVSVKHVAGPWLFAGSLAVAYGSYDNSRLVELPIDGMAPAVLDSDSSMTLVAGRLRAGYEFTFPDWYIRPYADLDFVYANAPGYREQGASLYALDVQGGDYTSVVFSPMLEIGGRFALDDAILRPYLSAGVSFNSNDTRVVSARFAGATAETGSFQTYLNMPAVIGTVMAGLTLYKAGGFEARAEYAFSAGDSFQAQSGSLRLAYHF